MFCLIRKLHININTIFLIITLFVLDQNQYAQGQAKPSDLVIKLAGANNEFAMSMFNIMSTIHGNQVISPISLMSAFGK